MKEFHIPYNPELDPEKILKLDMLVQPSALNFRGRIKRIFMEDGIKLAMVQQSDGFQFTDHLNKFAEVKD